MHHNHKPIIKLSSLKPHNYVLMPDMKTPAAACPYCGTMGVLFEKKLLPPHDGHPSLKTRRCVGSGQRFCIDVTFEQWADLSVKAFMTAAKSTTDPDTRRAGAFGPRGRRKGRVVCKGQPPVPVPVCRSVDVGPGSPPCHCARCALDGFASSPGDVPSPV